MSTEDDKQLELELSVWKLIFVAYFAIVPLLCLAQFLSERFR